MPFGFKTVRELIADQGILIRELQSQVKSLQMEWDEFYDKAARRNARERKRLRDQEASGEGIVAPPSAEPGGGPDMLPRGVLARRGRRVGATFGGTNGND